MDEAAALDRDDPLADVRDAFLLPEGVIYLDGNSLGPLTRAARTGLGHTLDKEWGEGLIRSWDDAGWMAAPARVGARIAPLVGAAADEVVVADSTTVNLFKLLATAVLLRPGRRTIVMEAGNFPTDGMWREGLARLVPGSRVVAVAAGALPAAMDADTAAVLLCHVHYRTGARHDMAALTAAAHAAGALTVWDVSHGVGAVEVGLNACGADFAAGCGYKFLNGGPGAPAFIFAAARHHAAVQPLQGWIGHADPFSFSDRHAQGPGMARFLSGTPGILGLAGLEAALSVWDGVDRGAVWAKSARMFELFAGLMARECPSAELLTPREPALRGSQIAFRHAAAAAVMGRLIKRGVIGDFRPPDILRFGLTPLYTRYVDVVRAVAAIAAEVSAA